MSEESNFYCKFYLIKRKYSLKSFFKWSKWLIKNIIGTHWIKSLALEFKLNIRLTNRLKIKR